MFFTLQATINPILGFLPWLAIGFVIFFFFIRPQAKKQKEQEQFISDLKKGDKVVTGSGIVGQISKVDDRTVQIQVDQKNYLTVVTSAISKEMTEQFLTADAK